MTEKTEVKIPISGIGIRHKARASIALIGNPNAGKSTLFNRLTGLRQTTGNFPGVTVEKHQGTVELTHSAFNLIDLPGIYSLDGTSNALPSMSRWGVYPVHNALPGCSW